MLTQLTALRMQTTNGQLTSTPAGQWTELMESDKGRLSRPRGDDDGRRDIITTTPWQPIMSQGDNRHSPLELQWRPGHHWLA